jgi:hypothetical protein
LSATARCRTHACRKPRMGRSQQRRRLGALNRINSLYQRRIIRRCARATSTRRRLPRRRPAEGRLRDKEDAPRRGSALKTAVVRTGPDGPRPLVTSSCTRPSTRHPRQLGMERLRTGKARLLCLRPLPRNLPRRVRFRLPSSCALPNLVSSHLSLHAVSHRDVRLPGNLLVQWPDIGRRCTRASSRSAGNGHTPVSESFQLGCRSVAPLLPQRTDRRNVSLDALAPQRIRNGARAAGAECQHRWPFRQHSQSQQVCVLSWPSVGTGGRSRRYRMAGSGGDSTGVSSR